ncbi:MAG: DNA helicase RecQ [bacterium]
MEDLLQKYFGYSTFRPLQREIIEGVLAKKDTFVLMPTGGGKSLCFQLPALMMKGLTIVVSPLIALMKDQVDGLIESGIPATFINSSLFAGDVDERMNAIRRGKIKLLYVAPERLMMPSFLEFLQGIEISLFAIDEAHCISEWGHDFRSDYRQLRILKTKFPGIPQLAMTASATERVQQDIVTQLHFGKESLFFKASFDRPNLRYAALMKDKQFPQLLHFLKDHQSEAGIIYCFSQKGTEAVAEKLRGEGFKALAYHAGLSAETRSTTQEKFVKDKIDIICATIAFGMGIDKSNVRFVIHYDLPKSLAGYYQETGRAGRDGEQSDCLLFYNYGDKRKIEYFFSEIRSESELKHARQELSNMMDFAQAQTCRRRIILKYFGEYYQKDNCGNCDICTRSNSEVKTDATRDAQMFLSCVARVDQRFGIKYVIDVLRGSEDQRILSNRHHDLSTYGIGKDKKVKFWQALAHDLLGSKYLTQDADNYNVLKLTPLAWEIMKGERTFQMSSIPVRAQSSRAGSEVASHNGAGNEEDASRIRLFEKLRVLRKNIADKSGLAPYMIFNDSSLRDMTNRLPKTPSEFIKVLGVSESKSKKYGKLFIEEIHAYLREHQALPRKTVVADYIPPKPAITSSATLRLFRQGQSPVDIAESRGLTLSTVIIHLEAHIASGEISDITRFVQAEKIPRIQAAFRSLGTATLAPIKQNLGESYTYEELRAVRAWDFANPATPNEPRIS